MNLSYRMTAALCLFYLSGVTQARPLDAIGPCKSDGVMTYADGLYRGNAKAMLAAPDFAQRHTIATTDEEDWVKTLSGISGKNRLFKEGKQRVVVVTLCKPDNCEHHRAYIAFDPDTDAYGASYYEDAHVREAGPVPTDRYYPAELGTAIWCAQRLDWKGK